MKKIILLVLSALALSSCSFSLPAERENERKELLQQIANNTIAKTQTHIYCYRSDSGWCDECEHYSDMNLNADNIISFNMTVMPYPDIYDTGIRHYHYCVVEVL